MQVDPEDTNSPRTSGTTSPAPDIPCDTNADEMKAPETCKDTKEGQNTDNTGEVTKDTKSSIDAEVAHVEKKDSESALDDKDHDIDTTTLSASAHEEEVFGDNQRRNDIINDVLKRSTTLEAITASVKPTTLSGSSPATYDNDSPSGTKPMPAPRQSQRTLPPLPLNNRGVPPSEEYIIGTNTEFLDGLDKQTDELGETASNEHLEGAAEIEESKTLEQVLNGKISVTKKIGYGRTGKKISRYFPCS